MGQLSGQPFFNDAASFATISAGAAIAAYSFLGFDAVTTLTEETINPRKNMPRAIVLIALIGGGIFVAVSYVTQLVHPGGVFEDSASAASSIALQIGGQLFGAVFLAGLVVAQFASGLAAQASAEQWLALNAARAIENSVYVAGVCQAPPVSVGRSVLVDPMGVVEADLGLEPGVRAVDVSLETVARVRELFPMFRQRRL